MQYCSPLFVEVFVIIWDGLESVAMRKQTVANLKKIEDDGSGTALGAPNLYDCAGLLDSLVERGQEELTHLMFQELLGSKTQYDDSSIADRAEVACHCQLEKQYRPDLKRLVIAIAHPVAEKLVPVLLKIGAEKKRGQAPMRYFERDLQE